MKNNTNKKSRKPYFGRDNACMALVISRDTARSTIIPEVCGLLGLFSIAFSVYPVRVHQITNIVERIQIRPYLYLTTLPVGRQLNSKNILT